jgi:hypothetical protein
MEMVSEQLVEFKQELHKVCLLIVNDPCASPNLIPNSNPIFETRERERERERETREMVKHHCNCKEHQTCSRDFMDTYVQCIHT